MVLFIYQKRNQFVLNIDWIYAPEDEFRKKRAVLLLQEKNWLTSSNKDKMKCVCLGTSLRGELEKIGLEVLV